MPRHSLILNGVVLSLLIVFLNIQNDSMYTDYLTGINNRKKLSFSMGYAVYDYNSHMKVEEFKKHIDILMYENKRANKEIKRH